MDKSHLADLLMAAIDNTPSSDDEKELFQKQVCSGIASFILDGVIDKKQLDDAIAKEAIERIEDLVITHNNNKGDIRLESGAIIDTDTDCPSFTLSHEYTGQFDNNNLTYFYEQGVITANDLITILNEI